MRIGLISDIHYGIEAPYQGVVRKLCSHAHRCTQTALANFRDAGVSVIVQQGDLIEDRSLDEDEKHFRHALTWFENAPCPVYHLIGNHDQERLPESRVEKMISAPLFWERQIETYRLVGLFAHSSHHRNHTISDEQCLWLKTLLSRKTPTLVFSHVPLDEQNLTGNFWYEQYPQDAFVANRLQVRRILEESRCVHGVFQGHVHQNRFEQIHGIPYFTLQSLVENLDNRGTCSESYAIVEASTNRLEMRVFGRDEAEYSVEIPE